MTDGRSLSGGMLVEASIVARLLRLKILTLDAGVLVLPAGHAFEGPPPSLLEHEALGRARARPPGTSGPRRRLGDAITSIEEGAALLAEARANRSLLDGPDGT